MLLAHQLKQRRRRTLDGRRRRLRVPCVAVTGYGWRWRRGQCADVARFAGAASGGTTLLVSPAPASSCSSRGSVAPARAVMSALDTRRDGRLPVDASDVRPVVIVDVAQCGAFVPGVSPPSLCRVVDGSGPVNASLWPL